MAPAFDEEELSISIPSSTNRRAHSKRSDQRGVPSNAAQQPPGAEMDDERGHSVVRNATRLGQYTILKTLGEGSFGKVKLAVHQVSQQKVALKIISRKKLINRDMAGRVEREIQYLQLLRHPHIIKLFTVITTPQEIIMVLEYAGGELFDYIVKHGKMAEDRARRFFQQIICAVEYCHRHKIVHRDLKPENLLLDEYLNVKIADFGLSNIMTDGNFLKTSCGSPNYAAPEVISGKLYAGPEVDVWSCGVILYVLLVGRLPFDDEYIPSLFRKIAQGNYVIPGYLSSGAVHMIKKMLVVNPVHRITVQEIRQDNWFNNDLAEYLAPPVEDFIDTGVNPNKAINPRALAPNKPVAVQEQLHEAVVGKLGKTMGYAKDDVQEALGKDEPSAIKDAYLIVRENQIMKTNPSLSNEQGLQPFLAQSPPAFTPTIPPPPHSGISTGAHDRSAQQSHSAVAEDLDRGMSDSTPIRPEDSFSRPSKIGILPTSLPSYHRAWMLGHQKSKEAALTDAGPISDNPEQQSSAAQAATARALRGQSRSQLALDKAAEKPESLTPLTPAKKTRNTKWQFGIRSRNQPHEALQCIYRALGKLGALWEIHDEYIPEDPWIIRVQWRKDGMLPPGMAHPSSNRSSSVNLNSLDARHSSVTSASSGQSSTSAPGATATLPSNASHTGPGSLSTARVGNPEESVYVYMDIQLYNLEKEMFLVDFKCAGYERLMDIDDVSTAELEARLAVHGLEMMTPSHSGQSTDDRQYSPNNTPMRIVEIPDHKSGGMKRVRVGHRLEEKDVSSAFPFLDLASNLIIALADGD